MEARGFQIPGNRARSALEAGIYALRRQVEKDAMQLHELQQARERARARIPPPSRKEAYSFWAECQPVTVVRVPQNSVNRKNWSAKRANL